MDAERPEDALADLVVLAGIREHVEQAGHHRERPLLVADHRQRRGRLGTVVERLADVADHAGKGRNRRAGQLAEPAESHGGRSSKLRVLLLEGALQVRQRLLGVLAEIADAGRGLSFEIGIAVPERSEKDIERRRRCRAADVAEGERGTATNLLVAVEQGPLQRLKDAVVARVFRAEARVDRIQGRFLDLGIRMIREPGQVDEGGTDAGRIDLGDECERAGRIALDERVGIAERAAETVDGAAPHAAESPCRVLPDLGRFVVEELFDLAPRSGRVAQRAEGEQGAAADEGLRIGEGRHQRAGHGFAERRGLLTDLAEGERGAFAHLRVGVAGHRPLQRRHRRRGRGAELAEREGGVSAGSFVARLQIARPVDDAPAQELRDGTVGRRQPHQDRDRKEAPRHRYFPFPLIFVMLCLASSFAVSSSLGSAMIAWS